MNRTKAAKTRRRLKREERIRGEASQILRAVMAMAEQRAIRSAVRGEALSTEEIR